MKKVIIRIIIVSLIFPAFAFSQKFEKLYDAKYSIYTDFFNDIVFDKNIFIDRTLPLYSDITILGGIGLYTPGNYNFTISFLEETTANIELNSVRVIPYFGFKSWNYLPYNGFYYKLLFSYKDLKMLKFTDVEIGTGLDIILFEPVYINLELSTVIRLYSNNTSYLVPIEERVSFPHLHPYLGIGYYF